jgi:hypothetical protein
MFMVMASAWKCYLAIDDNIFNLVLLHVLDLLGKCPPNGKIMEDLLIACLFFMSDRSDNFTRLVLTVWWSVTS